MSYPARAEGLVNSTNRSGTDDWEVFGTLHDWTVGMTRLSTVGALLIIWKPTRHLETTPFQAEKQGGKSVPAWKSSFMVGHELDFSRNQMMLPCLHLTTRYQHGLVGPCKVRGFQRWNKFSVSLIFLGLYECSSIGSFSLKRWANLHPWDVIRIGLIKP